MSFICSYDECPIPGILLEGFCSAFAKYIIDISVFLPTSRAISGKYKFDFYITCPSVRGRIRKVQ